MVGNRHSGRKADENSELIRYKKRSFYVKEYFYNGQWMEDANFTWFRRHHGARWQDRVREWMRQDVIAWRTYSHWRCNCDGGHLGNYRHNRIDKCHVCDTWKNEATRRINERRGPGGR
jgi:hypothetical protein